MENIGTIDKATYWTGIVKQVLIIAAGYIAEADEEEATNIIVQAVRDVPEDIEHDVKQRILDSVELMVLGEEWKFYFALT